MKNERKIADAKLGAMVIAGLIFLVFSLYMIGKNQNIFGTSMTVLVHVKDINGLLPGSNVRFKGMNVGTVAGIEMLNDSTIEAKLLVHKSMAQYIPNNSKTTINTDGLMGNKMIQLHPQEEFTSSIKEGDILYPLDQVGTEELLDKLDVSGNYLETTLRNLADVSQKLNESEAIWRTLSDSTLGREIKTAIRSFTIAGNNATALAKEGKNLLLEIKEGDGLASSLISDTSMVSSFQHTLSQLDHSTEEAKLVMSELKLMLQEIQQGDGAAGMVLTDSVFRSVLMETLINLEASTQSFNENMQALRSNFLFRRYFKKQEKAAQKAQRDSI
ncbi:MlaD family protein [Algoriphagus mannitolivorans]|uniref:MlaD family protein n=1 Tax=Algoriphagus mannitolivorans TaxID=226504 RepID=UPI00041C7335|nr:MlaD family protein [Algoriphagus mannitolivorans]